MKSARKNFLAEYQGTRRAQKLELLLKWGKAGGPKATTKGLVDITMTRLHKSKESGEAGHLTPGQVAVKAMVPLSCYSGDLKAWQDSLQLVINKNQEQHKGQWPEGVQPCIPSHDLWTSTYFYVHRASDAWTKVTSLEESVKRSSDLRDRQGLQVILDTPGIEVEPAVELDAGASKASMN
eukprot:6490368-Amphidinium_carterae.2